PATVTFECSLCQTRITALTVDVGRRVACPDCGRKNIIPPPPKPKQAVVPAAMEGEQYELWGVDEVPAGGYGDKELFPFECRVCQTLMYATREQFGMYQTCPDCGVRTIAKPQKRRSAALPLVSPGEEYQLDESTVPEPRPYVVPLAVRDAELHTSTRATSVGPDGRLIVQRLPERERRPVRPAVPLVQGVWRMLATQEVIARWVMLSLAGGAAGWFAHDALSGPAGGLAGFAGILFMVMAVVLTALWASMAAPLFLAMVSESAEGNDRLLEPPVWTSFDWLWEILYLVNAAAGAGLLALGAWKAPWPMPEELRVGLTALVVLLTFPVMLLGAMLEGSPFGVLSPRLWGTLLRSAGPWLLFYVESAALWGLAAAAGWAVMNAGDLGVLVLPPLAMGTVLLYMRLLGRLGWWLAEGPSLGEDDEDEPTLPARRRRSW
ncbi:MAG TPA: hypothetical protein PJ982_19465, partial [Lacipirellulaceae bacterium]|nr:hypothetical protein [Lacipirellulaceae bacterium]